MSPNQVFEHQTIAELAALVGKGVHSVADREVKTGPIPLTPIQHWFFGQNFPWLLHEMAGWQRFVLLGVGSELVAVTALMVMFRRRGWF